MIALSLDAASLVAGGDRIGPPLHIVPQQRRGGAPQREDRAERERGRVRQPAWPRVVDVLLVGLGGLAAAALGFGLTAFVVGGLALWVLLVHASEPTVSSSTRLPVQHLFRHGVTVLGITSFVAAVDLVSPSVLWATAAAISGGAVTALAVSAVRLARRGAVKVIVVGDSAAVTDLRAMWGPSHRVEVVAACLPDAPADRTAAEGLPAVPVFRSLEAVADTARRLGAEIVAVAPGGSVPPQELRRLGWMLDDVSARMCVIGLPATWAPHRLRPARLGRHPLVEVRPSRRSRALHVVKEALDRVGAAVLLVLAAPVLVAAAVAIRVDSRGPAFFRQRRVGIHGREFTMIKLRTMCTDAERLRSSLQQECAEKMLFKLEHDPRVTRVGQLLRQLSLDELPQLLNIVRGDMSLIGPRPALPEEVARYDQDARRRLVVKPGLTGLWQVSGRSDLSWEESLALDLHYVDNWRLCDDAVIAGRTFRAVISSRGAY